MHIDRLNRLRDFRVQLCSKSMKRCLRPSASGDIKRRSAGDGGVDDAF